MALFLVLAMSTVLDDEGEGGGATPSIVTDPLPPLYFVEATMKDKEGEIWLIQLASGRIFTREQIIYMIENNLARFRTLSGSLSADVIVVRKKLQKAKRSIKVLTTAKDTTQEDNLLKLRRIVL